MIAFLKKLFGRKVEPMPDIPLFGNEPDREVLDMGPDPLDPHGDGTLRPGDPLFDMVMGDGNAVLMNRRGDGKWDVKRFPSNEGRWPDD